MKQHFIALALSGLLVGSFLTSCNSNSEKNVDTAAEQANEAQRELDEAERRYSEEWEKFKVETEQRIRDNETEINTYRERQKTDKKFGEKYHETIDRLEAENAEMKVKMGNARENARENWEEFKREFNHDMEKLGDAIRDIGRDNKN